MPSPLIHLHILFQLVPNPSSDLVLGVISPDAIHMRPQQTWSDKAHTHFYEVAAESFTRALSVANHALQETTEDFRLGYLIHLHTDYWWREHMYTPFFKARINLMPREKLHELYYEQMKGLDQFVMKQAMWLDRAVFLLEEASCFEVEALLSQEEIERWRLKVIAKDLSFKHESHSFNLLPEFTAESFLCFTQQILRTLRADHL